jgi:hypothetical protein
MLWRWLSSGTNALMFCPVCKAEYRYGFTECSDCGVSLVEQLPDDSGAPGKFAGEPNAMEVLWAGVDARTCTSIESALDAAKIAYKEDSVESQFMPAFRQSIYRIEVRRADYESAVKSIQGLADSDAIDLNSRSALHNKNTSWLDPFGSNRGRFAVTPIGEPTLGETATDEAGSAPSAEGDSEETESAGETAEDDLLEDFYPEDATSEVWSGEDAEMAENFRVCLREVGINCDLRQENGKSRVFVLHQAEPRAREIIREIIEATAPE